MKPIKHWLVLLICPLLQSCAPLPTAVENRSYCVYLYDLVDQEILYLKYCYAKLTDFELTLANLIEEKYGVSTVNS